MTHNWNDKNGAFHPMSAMDFLPREELRRIQSQRLKELVKLAYENVPLHRSRMNDMGVTPSDIKGIDDISKLPFTQKSDLRDTYPYGLFAVDMGEVIRLHASSGTTGKPIVVGYTEDDMEVWETSVMRCLLMFGVQRGDILQNCFGYGLFTGGMGLHGGAQRLGCTVIPASGGNTERQLMIMRDFGSTAISCTPSYFIHMIEEAKKYDVDMKSLPLKFGIFGAEPWSEHMREYIEANTNVRAFDIYGLSEIAGPGVGGECLEHNGIHIFEDNFYPEIVDPETGEPLPDGEEGELVVTSLTREALPVVRYRTGDLTRIVSRERCACGRTHLKIAGVTGRVDDMLIIKGVNFFPKQIEQSLLKIPGVLPNYQIIIDEEHGVRSLHINVEAQPGVTGYMIEKQLKEDLGFSPDGDVYAPGTLPRQEGKAKRVFYRKNGEDVKK